jgi:hypothetical protein
MADEKIETTISGTSDSGSSHIKPHDSNAKEGVVITEKDSFHATLADDQELKKNPFADPDVAEYWRTVYDKSRYECRAVFDPTLEWTALEEKKLVRKLDWHVCLWAVCSLILSTRTSLTNNKCTMFFALQVDRGNLAQAVSDNFLDQLNLSTNGKIRSWHIASIYGLACVDDQHINAL